MKLRQRPPRDLRTLRPRTTEHTLTAALQGRWVTQAGSRMSRSSGFMATCSNRLDRHTLTSWRCSTARCSACLRQLDHVAVEVSVSRAATPRLLARTVNELGPRTQRFGVSEFDVIDPEADLGVRGPLGAFGLIQSKMQIRPVDPRGFAVRTADPTVLTAVITDLSKATPNASAYSVAERSRSATSMMTATSRSSWSTTQH